MVNTCNARYYKILLLQRVLFIDIFNAYPYKQKLCTFPILGKIYLSESSHPEVLLRKGVLKICSKFTGDHPRRSVISLKLQSSFIEITSRRGCSSVNLLQIIRTPFPMNTSGWLLLSFLILLSFCRSIKGEKCFLLFQIF